MDYMRKVDPVEEFLRVWAHRRKGKMKKFEKIMAEFDKNLREFKKTPVRGKAAGEMKLVLVKHLRDAGKGLRELNKRVSALDKKIEDELQK